MIVGLCGFAGAGKGAVAEYLRSKGWSHYSVKQVVVDELVAHGMDSNRDNLITMANSMRSQFGNDVLVQRIIKKLPADVNAIVESIRNPDEIVALRARGDFVLMAVDAPTQSRLQRLVTRARPGDPMTMEALKRLDEREEKDPSKSGIRIRECMGMADVLIINDSTLPQIFSIF